MFKTYQKKPVKVKVLLYSNNPNINTFLVEVTKDSITPAILEDGKIKFKTLEGDMTVSEGDYVICGTNGEYYPIKPDIFEQCYETEDNDQITQGTLTETGKKHLDSVLYLLDGALHDHSNRNYGDRDAWFDKIHNEWEEFINEHEESLNPLEYIQQVIKGII